MTNLPHTLCKLQNGSAAEDDVVDIGDHQTMQEQEAERPDPNPSQVRLQLITGYRSSLCI